MIKSIIINVNIFLILLISVSCSESSNSNKIVHPTDRNINPEFGITNAISISDTSYDEHLGIKRLINRIINHKMLFTIGIKEGNSYEMLGKIMDVYIDENASKVFVLDIQNLGVNIFDMNGDFLQKITREGRGPGELINPTSITKSGNRIFVLNKFYNIKIYADDSSNFEYIGMIDNGFQPVDFCINDSLLFINSITVTDPSSINNQDNIFSYRLSNYEKPVSKFGKTYESDSWFSAMHMSIGGIECTINSNYITQYFTYLNLIYGFNNSGTLLWITRIDDFHFLELIEKKGVGLGPDRSNLQNNFDTIERVVSLNKDYFLVQVANRPMSSERIKINQIKTYLVSYKDGSGVFIPKKLPLILSANTQKIAFLLQEEYPQIKLSSY